MHPRASLVTKIWCNMPLNMLRFKLFSTFLKAYSKSFLTDYTVVFFLSVFAVNTLFRLLYNASFPISFQLKPLSKLIIWCIRVVS